MYELNGKILTQNIKKWRVVKRAENDSSGFVVYIYYPQVYLGFFKGWVDAGAGWDDESTTIYHIKCHCKTNIKQEDLVVWVGVV
jgi:hypothetical protein